MGIKIKFILGKHRFWIIRKLFWYRWIFIEEFQRPLSSGPHSSRDADHLPWRQSDELPRSSATSGVLPVPSHLFLLWYLRLLFRFETSPSWSPLEGPGTVETTPETSRERMTHTYRTNVWHTSKGTVGVVNRNYCADSRGSPVTTSIEPSVPSKHLLTDRRWNLWTEGVQEENWRKNSFVFSVISPLQQQQQIDSQIQFFIPQTG